jgi:hypothetical protein
VVSDGSPSHVRANATSRAPCSRGRSSSWPISVPGAQAPSPRDAITQESPQEAMLTANCLNRRFKLSVSSRVFFKIFAISGQGACGDRRGARELAYELLVQAAPPLPRFPSTCFASPRGKPV